MLTPVSPRLSLVVTFASLLPFMLLLSACEPPPVQEGSPTEPGPVMVEVITLQPRPLVYPVHSLGRLVSADKLNVGVEVAGRVESVHFREGQRLAAGDKLLSLDSAKQRLRLKSASANVAGAQAELNQARTSYQRFTSLGDKGAVSKDELNKIESNFANAEARLAQFKADKKLAEEQLRDLVLFSPVDGIVEAETVEPGQKVQPGDQLGVIQTSDSLQLVTFVNEAEVNQIRVGSEATVRLEATRDRPHLARVESIALTASEQTGNFEVKLRVANPDGLLREGMTARVTLMLEDPEPLLVIPREAVVDRHRKRLVYLLVDGVAQAREPRLGLSLETGWAVLSGLQAGDQLIVSDLSQVYEGAQLVGQAVVQEAAGDAAVGEMR